MKITTFLITCLLFFTATVFAQIQFEESVIYEYDFEPTLIGPSWTDGDDNRLIALGVDNRVVVVNGEEVIWSSDEFDAEVNDIEVVFDPAEETRTLIASVGVNDGAEFFLYSGENFRNVNRFRFETVDCNEFDDFVRPDFNNTLIDFFPSNNNRGRPNLLLGSTEYEHMVHCPFGAASYTFGQFKFCSAADSLRLIRSNLGAPICSYAFDYDGDNDVEIAVGCCLVYVGEGDMVESFDEFRINLEVVFLSEDRLVEKMISLAEINSTSIRPRMWGHGFRPLGGLFLGDGDGDGDIEFYAAGIFELRDREDITDVEIRSWDVENEELESTTELEIDPDGGIVGFHPVTVDDVLYGILGFSEGSIFIYAPDVEQITDFDEEFLPGISDFGIFDADGDDQDELTVISENSLIIYEIESLNVADDLSKSPSDFEILSIYPNPFNSAVTISYQLLVPGTVSIETFDLSGNVVASLVNEQSQPGIHTTTLTADNLPSGLYLVCLQAYGQLFTQKVILIR
ncbi:MAG: T9SS type A sorting domain-containing protein [Candidatus Hatepunaea meridiana]|nr:T9SS type A sorting domain-containing protein [Candidatus Hatepunaea meridiana]